MKQVYCGEQDVPKMNVEDFIKKWGTRTASIIIREMVPELPKETPTKIKAILLEIADDLSEALENHI
jgi:hypothetical protein